MFVAVDLDGTLCDGSHKHHMLRRPERPGDPWPEQDWDAWLEACIDDAAIAPVLEFVYLMLEAGHRVEFWTGRGEHARDVTQRWLVKHFLGDLPLRMRAMDTPEAGLEPDHVAKARFLLQYGKPDLILEDKQSVVDMWRSHGIQCWQVAEGNY